MSVWLKDLHSNWPSWLAVALTCFISGMGFSLAVALINATGDDTTSLGGTILGLAICSNILVIFSQMKLIIDEHIHIYRSWRMVGMPNWLIFVLVLGQIAAVSTCGAVPGAFCATFLTDFALDAFHRDNIRVDSISVTMGGVVLASAVCVLAAVLGGFLSLRRIYRSGTPRWAAAKCALAFILGAGILFACTLIDDPTDAMSACLGLIPLFAFVIPWMLPLLMQWTRPLGIAGANVRVRSNFTAPHIMPWILFGGLIIAVGSGLRAMLSMEEEFTMSPWQVFVVVLGPTIAPSVMAAFTTSLLMRKRIAHDAGALTLAGAARNSIFRVQIGEAFALTATTTGLLSALTLFIVLLMNHEMTGEYALTGFWWQALLVQACVMFIGLSGFKCGLATNFRDTTAHFRP